MTVPYVLHKYPFTWEYLLSERKYNIVSIDPGVKNMGFCVERRRLNSHTHLLYLERVTLKDVKYVTVKAYFDQFNYSHVKLVIIEEQMAFNSSVARIAKYILSYFVCKVNAIIIEVSPKLKSKILNPKVILKGPALKEWEIQEALSLLIRRGDQRGISEFLSEAPKDYILNEDLNTAVKFLKRKAKLDDKATSIVQTEALMIWLLSNLKLSMSACLNF